jgi:two-component system phosphate regulon sensor histidine kinase PhoR
MDSRTISVSQKNKRDSNRKNFSNINTIYIDDKKGEKFRIQIDSLFNDSIPVDHLTTVFAKTLSTQKLAIPFTILRQPEETPHEDDFFRRPPPFDNVMGYKLQLGNAFSYLIKKISLPILFSVFLVGLTVFSFVLLYRSLLRQHRLAQLKNDLISNITHELKTPIATVGVAIEALKNFNAIQDPNKTKEYLDISQNELQRLGLLVDKVLKLSMFENKEMELKYELFDLEEVVNEVVASLRLQLEKYNARIRVNTEGNLLIKGDRTHLLSVVFNLLDNALKYSKGNTAIEVVIKERERSIELKVTDNGIGIPAQYREKIFEKFFRVPTGDTHNAKGHGLGLSYVAKVIQRHNGSINVNSHEGLGNTFTIQLPKTTNA